MPISEKIGVPSLRRNALAGLKDQVGASRAHLGALATNTADLLRRYAVRWVKKWNATVCGRRRAAKGNGVAEGIVAKQLEPFRPTDGDIARAAAHQIDLMTSIPSGALEITVNQGRVTLEGDVEWDYQQTAAGNAVKYLSGVREVKNLIGLRPDAEARPDLRRIHVGAATPICSQPPFLDRKA
jgi:hypothetical protein